MPARKTRSISKKRLAELLSKAAVGAIPTAAGTKIETAQPPKDKPCIKALQALARSAGTPDNPLVPDGRLLTLLP